MQILGLGQDWLGLLGGHKGLPSWAMAPAYVRKEWVCGRMSWARPQQLSVHMRDRAREGTNEAAASIGMCIGWCKGQTKPDYILADTNGAKFEVTPGKVSCGTP